MAFSGAQITRIGLSGFHRPLYGDFSGKTQSDSPVVEAEVADQPSGGALFWYRYEQEMDRRRKERKRLQDLEEKAEQVEDAIEREIAKELREDDREQARINELRRLRKLAVEFKQEIPKTTTTRVVKAADRAAANETYSAMEAFEREMARMVEEERFLAQAVRILIDA